MEGKSKKISPFNVSEKSKIFHNACLQNQVELVKILIREKNIFFNVNLHDHKIALNNACLQNNVELVKLLLERKDININLPGPFNDCSFLKNVCMHNRAEMIKLLLEREDLDINARDRHGETALLTCCVNHSLDVMRVLLQRKDIDINLKKHRGWSPLRRSYYEERIEQIKLLLSHGASTEGWDNWSWLSSRISSLNADGLRPREHLKIMINWRSYLPKWKTWNYRFYPQEFKDLALNCMKMWNRLEKMFYLNIPKDMKRLLIEYVADGWREKKESLFEL